MTRRVVAADDGDGDDAAASSRVHIPTHQLAHARHPRVCARHHAVESRIRIGVKGVKRSDMDDESTMNTVETLETMTTHILLVNQ